MVLTALIVAVTLQFRAIILANMIDTLLLLIYIDIGLFGVILGCIAWGRHREGQRHDPER